MHPKTDKMERLHMICFLGLGLEGMRGVNLDPILWGWRNFYMVGVRYYPLMVHCIWCGQSMAVRMGYIRIISITYSFNLIHTNPAM